jgi:hypothetical protein
MSIKTTTVYGSDRKLGCFAWPERAKAPLPAGLVLQEARGVDAFASLDRPHARAVPVHARSVDPPGRSSTDGACRVK